VVGMNPHYTDARLKLASALRKMGDVKAARKTLKKALKLDPANENVKAFLELIDKE
jgi:Tfp pilus assembly protein PilF